MIPNAQCMFSPGTNKKVNFYTKSENFLENTQKIVCDRAELETYLNSVNLN